MTSIQKLQYAELPVMSCHSVSRFWQQETRRKEFLVVYWVQKRL